MSTRTMYRHVVLLIVRLVVRLLVPLIGLAGVLSVFVGIWQSSWTCQAIGAFACVLVAQALLHGVLESPASPSTSQPRRRAKDQVPAATAPGTSADTPSQ